MSSSPIAAASWLPRTPSAPDLAQAGDDRVRLGSVAHDVAQLPDLVHRWDHRQHRVQGRDVGMDVRQDGDAHRGSVAQRPRRRRPGATAHNGPLATLGGVARVARIDRPGALDDDQAMGLEAGHARVEDLEAAGAQGVQRRAGGGQLLVQRQALPGDEDAARARRAAARPRPARTARRRPATVTAGHASRSRGSCASASARTASAATVRPSPVASITVARKPTFLAMESTSRTRSGGQGGGDGQAGEAPAAAEVEERRDPARPQQRRRRPGCRRRG